MPTILVVDDCAAIARIVEGMLRTGGYKVVTAFDGASALKMIERDRPDCVLLDLLMPGMTGVEVLQQLRTDPETATLPIILVSARVGMGRTHVLFEGDADFCLSKPFTRVQILHAVKTVLARRAAALKASVAAAQVEPNAWLPRV